MTVDLDPPATEQRQLLPLLLAVFVVFLITGLALPVLPLHVTRALGMNEFVVGLVSGAQFIASLVSRIWAGSHADTKGPKRAVLFGLGMAIGAGLLYLASVALLGAPMISVAVLVAGRALLGGAESFIITGAQSWGLALAGPKQSGRVIAWMGTAMYGALAVGAPVGTALYGLFGFAAVGVATLLIPVLTLALVAPLQGVKARQQQDRAIARVTRAVLVPGIGLSFACLGFGAMTALSVLLFVERNWEPAWLSFTTFAVAFIAARLLLGHLSDRIGGARVAFLFGLIEAAGFLVIWASPWAWLGLVGAALTGFGFSLVYPGLGLEAVHRAPPENRGLALGIYTAFLDLTLGVLTPVLGLLASGLGLGSVFLVSGLLVLCSAPVSLWLMRTRRTA